jgi:hypothetical protein
LMMNCTPSFFFSVSFVLIIVCWKIFHIHILYICCYYLNKSINQNLRTFDIFFSFLFLTSWVLFFFLLFFGAFLKRKKQSINKKCRQTKTTVYICKEIKIHTDIF